MKINGFFWILNKAKGMCDKESKNNIEEVILNNSWYVWSLKKKKLNCFENKKIKNDNIILEKRFKKKAVEKIIFWFLIFFSFA